MIFRLRQIQVVLDAGKSFGEIRIQVFCLAEQNREQMGPLLFGKSISKTGWKDIEVSIQPVYL